MQPWYASARNRLLDLRQHPWGWGASVARELPRPEPTALACLALLAADDQPTSLDTLELIDASAEWLGDLQQADGAVGGTPDLPEMCCPTACAALLWSQFSAYQRPLAAALRWLQQCDPSAPHAPAHALPGYPPRRGAWFWNEPPGGALDPAGIAILALCRNQLTGHQRIIESVEWILARASHSDGWHAGPDRRERSNQVSDVGYTGTLLLTLRAAGLAETEQVTQACHFLEDALPDTREPERLAWGLLGYMAWRARHLDASDWLHRAYIAAPDVADSPIGLAMLILADRPATFPLLGVRPALPEATPRFVWELLGD